CMTRSRVASRTVTLPLMTRDTVIGDTPALWATSWIVTASPPFRRTGFFFTCLRFASLTRGDSSTAHVDCSCRSLVVRVPGLWYRYHYRPTGRRECARH